MLVAVSLATVRRWLCLTPMAKPRRELEQALQWVLSTYRKEVVIPLRIAGD